MANVFSVNFFRHPAQSGGPTAEFAVPGGHVAVVKCITITWGDIVASGLDAWVQTQDLCKLLRYSWAFTLSDPTNFGGTLVGYGAWTLEAGESLESQCNAGTCDIQASGYLLQLP